MWEVLENDISQLRVPSETFFANLVLFTVFFVALQYALGSISSRLFSTFDKLHVSDKEEWINKMFSNIHAVTSALLGTYLFFSRKQYYDEMDLLYNDDLTMIMVAFSMAYMMVDLYLVLKHFPRLGGTSMIFHHTFIIIGGVIVSSYNQFVLFPVSACLTEYTTLFINQRWFLDKCGYRQNLWYVINGLVIWFTWTIFRVGYSIYLVALIRNNWDVMVQTPLILGPQFFLQAINLTVLNMMWFYKITMGIVNILLIKKKMQ